MVAKDVEDLLPLSPAVLHILLALANGEMHGYAIMQEVVRSSDNTVKMGPGTLYGAIKRLLTDGWITEADERPDPDLDDERRRYYKLTDFGARIVSAEVRRLASVVKSARAKKLVRMVEGVA